MTEMLKDIAWNGVQLSVPTTWELNRVETRYLFLETQTGPAMEIKWGHVKGRFSHHSHLKKLMVQHKRHPQKQIQEWPLPPTWENALSNFVAKGFSWNSDTDSGRGAILYCPSCRTAVMFQVFNLTRLMPHETFLNVLKSLQDHRDDGQSAWIVFDIQALLPKTFQLKQYRFKPGSYELLFSNKFQSLKLSRWAPASSLLSQTDLSSFAADTLNLNQKNLITTSALGHAAVEWKANAIAGWTNRLYRFKRKPVFHWARVWHVTEKNRVLGIHLDSKKPFDTGLVTDICSKYRVRSSPKL
jgi:hypothetical protein